jgi:hypothetical protein
MRTNKQSEKQASHIADAIVDLVERCDGPVTLAQINREIPGFGTNEDPSWDYHIKHEGGVSIIWDGMTEAGTKALRKVIRGRRVAVQLVDARLYILEGYSIRSERCVPVVLLPARAANLETPAFPLLRVAPRTQHEWMMQATAQKKPGNRLLTPGSVRSTADCFSPV